MPKRIQRKRTKGWKMPPNTVSVCRPGLWGNPYKVGEIDNGSGEKIQTAAHAVKLFRDRCMISEYSKNEAREHLRGKDLACWCKLDQPCHADVLLEVSNGGIKAGGVLPDQET